MNFIHKVAAGVVLYHPDSGVLANISSYNSAVDKLIVVDNSETLNLSFHDDLRRLFPEVEYLFLNRNAGIAAALNIACKIAIQNECSWLLTMDQDSNFKDDQLAKLISGIDTVTSQYEDVGIISPHHVLHENHVPKTGKQYTVKNIAMTSGNLLNLAAYKKIGSFDEKLFMDFVDYEYCLRLRKNNFKIIQDSFVHLKHSLGNYAIKKVFGRKIGVSNHNAVRRYYMTRNGLYVAFKYFWLDKKFFAYELWNVFLWDFFVIVSFEKNKALKLKSVSKGIFHFLLKRFGKIAG